MIILSWIFIIILANVGYFWVQKSWGVQPKPFIGLPIRYKFLFTGLLFMLIFAYSPIVIIPGILIWKFVKYSKRKYKNFKLQKYYSLIYDPKFNFRKLLPKLDSDFFTNALTKKEIKIMKKKFSNKLTENKPVEDLCPICYVCQKKGELCTAIPGCEHEFHFKCLKVWLE